LSTINSVVGNKNLMVQIKEKAKAAAAAAEPAQSSFPPAMRAYVERAFLSAKTNEQKKVLHPALKEVQISIQTPHYIAQFARNPSEPDHCAKTIVH
jgi:hypothetical protein